MKIKKSVPRITFEVFNTVIMLLLIFICAYPLIYVLLCSLSDPVRLSKASGLIWHPLGFTLKGYELVIKNPDIMLGYKNTLIFMITGTSINMIITILGAFVLSRKGLMIFKPMMIYIAITMFFGGGLIPTYLLIRNLGILDSMWAIILPTAINTWNLVLMRTSFEAIPTSLEESAKIDGANDWVVLTKLILPMSVPALAVITLYYAVAHWNSWFSAMIYLSSRPKFPLQLILREILISNDISSMKSSQVINEGGVDMNRTLVQYTTVIVATLPITFIYPFLQKYFVKGILIGAIKG